MFRPDLADHARRPDAPRGRAVQPHALAAGMAARADRWDAARSAGRRPRREQSFRRRSWYRAAPVRCHDGDQCPLRNLRPRHHAGRRSDGRSADRRGIVGKTQPRDQAALGSLRELSRPHGRRTHRRVGPRRGCATATATAAASPAAAPAAAAAALRPARRADQDLAGGGGDAPRQEDGGPGHRAPWKALSPSPPKRPRGPPIPAAVLNAAARWRPEDEDEDDDRTAPYLQ